MTFEGEPTIERVAALAKVREAGETASELEALWPLTDAAQMDNDAKYVENLQVRITTALAEAMTGEEIRPADAEYVYEGAETIPGCDQRIVDALLAANDAYDTIDEFSETKNTDVLFEAASLLGAGWDDATVDAVRAHVADLEAYIDARIAADGHFLLETTPAALAGRFAIVVVAIDDLLRVLLRQLGCTAPAPQIGGAGAARVSEVGKAALPLVPFANELAEQLSVPRLYASAGQLRGLVAAYETPNGDYSTADAAVVLGETLAPMAAAEWRRHREDVLWDAEKAKEEAKAEDERKNKEALAAKFAHVKDDPNKETVEL
ncbi:hypothetical protein [Bifidobacterium choloepi]|uniref:Uncharacterized protein n=1 Tax=Bifidobacterium choloepi TaxID=2614131 RepID=A0A6I5NBE6_9BIFI|nr:hypothetical protein [Bifidobacterium choloepi]NEG69810.1 hypothetical protein [Bifidobacterium choloepi]